MLINDENDWTLTKRNCRYNCTHKDINRDFPYLVKDQACMETIGARVVNELFLNHMFSMGLSLHAGTESLAFPYGTPNHIKKAKKIPMKYVKLKGGRVKNKRLEMTDKITQMFKDEKYDLLEGEGTPTPDSSGMKGKGLVITMFRNISKYWKFCNS